MFVTKFIVSNVFSVVLVGIILLLKKVLHSKASLKFQYHIWFVLLFSLSLVFLPIVDLGSVKQITASQNNTGEISVTAPDMVSDKWLYDFTEMADTVNKIEVNAAALLVWTGGMFLVLTYYCRGIRKLRMIWRFSVSPSKRVTNIFELCLKRVSVKNKIHLMQSDMVTSPLSFGCRKSYIVLPIGIIKELSDKEIEHILLHELTHIKNKDIRINILSCTEQLIYWFNPVIWKAFSTMKCDREAYCDWKVLNVYATQEERLSYGDTLLRFAAAKRNIPIHAVNSLFENKAHLKYRIEKIADYRKETRASKITGNCFIIVLAFAVILQTPAFAAFGYDFGVSYMPKREIKINEQDYCRLFNDTYGCAVIYDLEADVYNVYNKSDITKRTAPCSTFKIYSAINALEQGVITANNNFVRWDGLSRSFPSWNSDQNLNLAMRNSVNWYFQFLDRTSGTEQLKEFYKSIGYGNGCVGGDTEYYWNGSGLKISPLEQVELLVKLYTNEFNFNEDNVNAVKNAIFLSETNGVKLYGKTGTGKIKNSDVNGWFIGFAETADNTYFFAFNIQADKNANGSSASKIAYSVFETMGIKLN